MKPARAFQRRKPEPEPHREVQVRVEVVPRLALTVAEAAASVGIPEGTLRDAIKRGELVVVNVGGGLERRRLVIRPADIEAWLVSRRIPARDESSS